MIKLALILNGRFGNNLFQLSFIHFLKKKFPEIEVFYPEISQLGIVESEGWVELAKTTPDLLIHENSIDTQKISELNSSRGIYLIHSLAWGMQPKFYENSKENLRKVILESSRSALEPRLELAKNKLTFHIRGGDIWQTGALKRARYIHPDYTAVPTSFYETVSTNFVGEVEFIVEQSVPKWYLKHLRQRLSFNIKTSKSIAHDDFLRISSGSQIGLGVSTFSWMAAFVGNPEIVHFPMLGIFNKSQRPDLDFINPNWRIKKYAFEDHKWSGNAEDRSWISDSACFAIE